MKKAVLVGHNYTTLLGLAGALGRNGYEVGVIRTGLPEKMKRLHRVSAASEASSKYIGKS